MSEIRNWWSKVKENANELLEKIDGIKANDKDKASLRIVKGLNPPYKSVKNATGSRVRERLGERGWITAEQRDSMVKEIEARYRPLILEAESKVLTLQEAEMNECADVEIRYLKKMGS